MAKPQKDVRHIVVFSLGVLILGGLLGGIIAIIIYLTPKGVKTNPKVKKVYPSPALQYPSPSPALQYPSPSPLPQFKIV